MKGHLVPPLILEHWYVCGRKVPYATETIAFLAMDVIRQDLGREPTKGTYLCPYGMHWHVGTKAKKPYEERNSKERHQTRQERIRAWNQQAYAANYRPRRGVRRKR